jgi:hypothetical protein
MGIKNYTKNNPNFYLICKKCGSDEMFFKKIELDPTNPDDTGVCVCCDDCGELNPLNDYLII